MRINPKNLLLVSILVVLILALVFLGGIGQEEVETTTTIPQGTTSTTITTTSITTLPEGTTTTTQIVSAKGGFILLISDAPADIEDFDSLEVSFSKMRIFKTNDSFDELSINKTVDLTEVVGEKAISVLDISLDVGTYSKIELFASNVEGIVDGDMVDVKIPSEKLKIVRFFEIKEGETTTFIFDINVVRKGTGDYNLLPVIAKSGVVDVDIPEPPEVECTVDEDCNEGEVCTDGVCVTEEEPEEAIFTCCFDHDECFDTTIEDCREQGGYVFNCIPDLIVVTTEPPSEPINYTPANLTANEDLVNNVTDVLNESNISNRTYVNDTYDCDDFAGDFETYLQNKTYNATFTIFWCRKGNETSIPGHAITDVHASDGSLIFIDPQNGVILNMDMDGDGVVETINQHPAGDVFTPTDDNCQIEVYGSRTEAEAAGNSLD